MVKLPGRSATKLTVITSLTSIAARYFMVTPLLSPDNQLLSLYRVGEEDHRRGMKLSHTEKARESPPALTLFYLARKNIMRRRFRTAITVICLTVMIGTLFATELFTQGVGYGLQIGTERLGADLIVVPAGTVQSAQTFLLTGHAESFYMNESALRQIRNLPDVEHASPQLFLTTLQGVSCCATGNLQVVGIDPQSDFTVLPWLKGQLPNGFSRGQGIVGAQVYGNFGSLQPKFFGRNFTVVGELEPTDLGLDNSFFITIADARSIIQANSQGLLPNRLPITILPDQISDVTVKLKPGTSIPFASAEIKSQIPGVDVVTASDMTLTVQRELAGLLQSMYVAGGAVWGVSLIMIGAIFSMSVNERRREIGLMRALGSTSRFIYRLITMEGTLLTTIGGLLGLGVGAFVIYVFNGLVARATELNFVWPSTFQIVALIAESMAVSIVIGVAASAYPAYTSSRMEPYAAMRQE